MRTIKEIVTLLALAVSTLTLPLPLGRFDDGFKLGWHGSAAASYTLALSPVAFQVEGAFSRFNDDQAGADLKQNLFVFDGLGSQAPAVQPCHRWDPARHRLTAEDGYCRQ